MKKVLNLFIVICFMFILSSCNYTEEVRSDVYTKEEVVEILKKYYTGEEVNIYLNQKLNYFKNDYFTKDEVLKMLNDVIDSLSDDVLWEGNEEITSSYFTCDLLKEDFDSYRTIRFYFGIGSYGPYANNYYYELNDLQMEHFKNPNSWNISIDQLLPCPYSRGFLSFRFVFDYDKVNEDIMLSLTEFYKVGFSNAGECTVSLASEKIFLHKIIGVKK